MRQRLIVLLIIVGPFGHACGTRSERSSRPTEEARVTTESSATSEPLERTDSSASEPLDALSCARERNTDLATAWPLERPPDGWRAQQSAEIPVVPGLTEVVAVNEPQGDYESIGSVESATSSTVTYSFSVRSGAVSGIASNRARRIVPRRDIEDAHGYRMTFSSADPESFPGQTAVGISSAVFRELQDTGRSRLDLYASTDVVGAVAAILSARGAEASDLTGELARAESESVGVPVLVNGRRVWLPALHAKGDFQRIDHSVQAAFWFLADVRNPMTLRAAVDRTRLQVVRIDFPANETAPAIERALADRQPVEMWGCTSSSVAHSCSRNRSPYSTKSSRCFGAIRIGAFVSKDTPTMSAATGTIFVSRGNGPKRCASSSRGGLAMAKGSSTSKGMARRDRASPMRR
jgi:hypothetical protein